MDLSDKMKEKVDALIGKADAVIVVGWRRTEESADEVAGMVFPEPFPKVLCLGICERFKWMIQSGGKDKSPIHSERVEG